MAQNKIKRVLIALDYGPTAQKVAEAGFFPAKSIGAEVTLLHVIATPTYYTSIECSPIMGFGGYLNIDPMQEGIAEEIKTESGNYLDKVKAQLGDPTTQVVLEDEDGNTSKAILSASKKVQADLIVIGSHSRRWLTEIIMGNVAEKVLQKTIIPLYIVPAKKSNSEGLVDI